jgi:hypothetical protein
MLYHDSFTFTSTKYSCSWRDYTMPGNQQDGYDDIGDCYDFEEYLRQARSIDV